MADNRNFAALDWLIHEIGETLKEARQALEAYVENPKDAVRIRFCLTHIHQVHGSLQMVEFFGAAMLAEEMERLTQAMIQGTVGNAAEAQEVLMRAILQFPVYLEQVKATRKDNPLVVLPLLNDLRAVRGESLLTDTKLFVPNLAPAKKVTGPRSPAAQDNVQFQAMALKLRQMYQYAAAGFIRNVNSDENLAYLQKVFNRLHKLTQGTARHALWDICMALAEALEIDALEISVAIKNLLRQLDKEIKILAVHGTKALNSYTNDELIKNLLYYVARAGKHAPGFNPNSHLQRIYQAYRLDEALIEGRESGDESANILSAPDADAMRSVVEALKTELDIIKNALDICLSGGDVQTALNDALPVVKRIADTMAVLGLGDLRKQVLEQGAALEMVARVDSHLSHDQLMSIASKVIEIEDLLDGIAKQQSTPNSQSQPNEGDITLSRAKESVLRESRNGLEHAKDAIIEYIASQWDRTHLQNVPDTLREIRGGLDIMPLPRAARILGACARYIEERLLTQDFTPQWASLDTLADAITSVEYYLERLSAGANSEENDLLLSVAEESVANLGYAVAKTSRSEVPGVELDAVRSKKHADKIETTAAAAEADEASLAAAYESVLQVAQNETETEELETALPSDAEPTDSMREPEPAPQAGVAPASLLRRQAPSIGNHYPRPETTVIVSPDISVGGWGNSGVPSAPKAEAEPAPIESAAEADISTEAAAELVTDLPEAVVLPAEPLAESVEPEVEALAEPEPEPIPVAPAPAPVAQAQPAADEDEIDEEIIEIFVEEASEVTETIGHYFPRWAKNFDDQEALTEFRRAFHTLKGSGRMVGANDIGELAWSIENMLNRVIDRTISPAAEHVAIIEKVRALLPDMIEAFSEHKPNPHAALSASYRGIAEALSRGEVPAELLVASAESIQEPEPEVEETPAPDEMPVAVGAPEASHTAAPVPEAAYAAPVEDDDDMGDAQLWDIFGAEALTHLQVVEEFIAHMDAEAPCYEPPSDAIQRALHTLKGSAHMAEITPIAELAAPLEKFVKELRSYHVVINDDILQLLRDAVSYTQTGLHQIERGESVSIPRLHQFVARVNELREIHVAPLVRQQEMDANGKRPVDPQLLSIFMAEEMNLLLNADKIIAKWRDNPEDVLVLQPVLEELRNLTRGAQHAYLPPMAQLGEKLEHVYIDLIAKRLPCNDDVCGSLNAAHVALLDMVDAIAAGQNLTGAPAHIHDALDYLLAHANAAVPVEVAEESAANDAEPAAQTPEEFAPVEDEGLEFAELEAAYAAETMAESVEPVNLAEPEEPVEAAPTEAELVESPELEGLELEALETQSFGVEVSEVESTETGRVEVEDIELAEPVVEELADIPALSEAVVLEEPIAEAELSDEEFILDLDLDDSELEEPSLSLHGLASEPLAEAEFVEMTAGAEDVEIGELSLPETIPAPEALENIDLGEELPLGDSAEDQNAEVTLELAPEADELEAAPVAADIESLELADTALEPELIEEIEAPTAELLPQLELVEDEGTDEITLELVEQVTEPEIALLETTEDAMLLAGEDEELDFDAEFGDELSPAAEVSDELELIDEFQLEDETEETLGDEDLLLEQLYAEAQSDLTTSEMPEVTAEVPMDLPASEAQPEEITLEAAPAEAVEEPSLLQAEEDEFSLAEAELAPLDALEESQDELLPDLDSESDEFLLDDEEDYLIDQPIAAEADDELIDLEVAESLEAEEFLPEDEPLFTEDDVELPAVAALHDEPLLDAEAEAEELLPEEEASLFIRDEEPVPAPHVPPKPALSQEPPKPAVAARPKPVVAEDDDFDPEIVEIFIEEASELLEDMERALHDWQEDWNNTESVEELKRCLHTFKGGARLAGLTELGDLSHNFETVLIDMDANTDIDQNFFKQLNSYQDRLHAGVAEATARLSGGGEAEEYESADEEIETSYEPEAIESTEENQPMAEESPAVEYGRPALVVDNERSQVAGPVNKPNVLTFAPKPKPASAPIPKIPGSEFGGNRQGATGPGQVQHLAARRAGPQEVVKVSAELLEELVNLAGETSISRSRMEQQVSDLGSSIEEMDATIHRLQEQLRRLDIETEAQVLFRQEQMAQHEEFDPLEMDRYSQLQQLSRSLMESASDLMDLKYTLADKTRDTETLLLQQSRINTDLQEGLMRSRMVPFSRLVPRLRRIVRQAADELGKEVDFELDNVEGELDRTVLERMVAPLEHMLRNAVDHGIESPADRAAAGKPAMGRIALSLGREGGDVILRLADDGRGINLQRVREKAIERGLMAADAPLSDQDLMQFILHAGFSTADKVTQISGRGVGMDVVHSEIKQLGGAMFIDSRWGEGTEFTIRLPFTVSVNRALMIQIGDDLYAIPLNTIEGIVRVSPFELEHYYQDPEARFDYAGENYLVRYLGTMLDSDAMPKLDGQALPLPVILVRSTENTVALQVDRLLGSREIVVKTLGAQFSAVRGVSGATVTGDGSVVVILDLHALIREQLALGLNRAMLLESLQAQSVVEEDQVEKVIMVVDDSVTVRKVTSRFLEREGFRVITAKDGVEALQLLQDHIPDVMLLDIEMPRMDGFEVAKNIRTSSRLRDIPIIMITSRTGEKHRERAFELGVNKYMGKPYQEDLLLQNIQELIKKPVK